MSLFKEFRDFAMRGNVVDLAVGVIIGAAFGKIVSSLVANIIMPPLGLLIGGVDFKQFKWILKPAEGDIPAVVMEYGNFIQTIFDFVIVAFAIFLAIKVMNKMYKKKEVEKSEPKPTNEELLLTEIRDLLKQQNHDKL
jgi:large conductance mechanosensitive channel